MPAVRAFLAVSLPVALHQPLVALQRELSGGMPGGRWIPPGNVHLTLRFFGDVHVDNLEKIHASMLSVCVRARAFDAGIQGVGAFPDGRRPRVVWLGLVPRELLSALQETCREALATAGFPAEPREFVPHLTIGRFRAGGPDLCGLLAAREMEPFGRLPVDRLTLFESRLLPGGARYLPLFTVPLAGTI